MFYFRYGYTPLPNTITKHHFELRVDSSTSEELKELALKWYTLDKNSISNDSNGVYVLQNLTQSESNSFLNDVYPKLLKLLSGLPFDMDNHDLLINRSVTEYEVKTALKNECECQERMFWLYRKFSGGINQSDPEYLDYNDTLDSHETRQSYNNLIEWMQKKIPSHRMRVYNQCSFASYQKNDQEWTQQFHKWRKDIHEELNSSLQNIVRRRSSWDLDGCGIGVLEWIAYSANLIELFFHYCQVFRDLSSVKCYITAPGLMRSLPIT